MKSKLEQLMALETRVRRMRFITSHRQLRLNAAQRLLTKMETRLETMKARLLETERRGKIVDLHRPGRGGYRGGGRVSEYHARLLGMALVLICAHLCPSVASAQVKGATALLNLVAAPAAPTMSTPLALPAASLAPRSITPDRTKMNLSWTPNGVADSYKVYWGAVAGNYTNSVTVTNTTATIGVMEGVMYYFVVAALQDGKESPPSNMVSATAGFYVDLVDYIKIVRTRGKAGSTNRVQETLSPSGPWTTLKTFVGNGAWNITLTTNTTAQKFFRTISP